MTIIVATPDRIVADSRLAEDGKTPFTVCKIFPYGSGKRQRGIFATAGDSRLTHHFESHMKAGRHPPPIEGGWLEDESLEAVLVTPAGIVCYDTYFSPFQICESVCWIGSSSQVVASWMQHGHKVTGQPVTPEDAVRRAIEVDAGCGFPIVVVHLDGRVDQIHEDGTTEHFPNIDRRPSA